jgi:hypothetical protein
MADDARYKTEYCRHYPACPYGDKCLYAHSRSERRRNRHHRFRQRPCWAWVSTGTCPYGNKCIFIHDPRIEHQCKFVPHPKSYTGISPTKDETDILQWPLQRYKQEQEPISPRVEYNIHKSPVLMTDVTRVIYKSLIKGVKLVEMLDT